MDPRPLSGSERLPSLFRRSVKSPDRATGFGPAVVREAATARCRGISRQLRLEADKNLRNETINANDTMR